MWVILTRFVSGPADDETDYDFLFVRSRQLGLVCAHRSDLRKVGLECDQVDPESILPSLDHLMRQDHPTLIEEVGEVGHLQHGDTAPRRAVQPTVGTIAERYDAVARSE